MKAHGSGLVDRDVRRTNFEHVDRDVLEAIAELVLEAADVQRTALGAQVYALALIPPGILFVRGNMGGPWQTIEVLP